MSAKKTNLKDLSVEELEALKKKQMEVMESQLPYLRVEEEYARLQASIERSRYEEHIYRLKWAEFMVNQNKKPAEPTAES